MANTFITNRGKSDKIAKPVVSKSRLASALTGVSDTAGPKGLDASRDAWANAMQQMQGVRATDPITAAAQVAGMGLAGYGQGRAVKQREQGEMAFRARLADALNGGGLNPAHLKELMSDPYADGSQDMLMKLWERANPDQDTIQRRRQAELSMKRDQQVMNQSDWEYQQKVAEQKRLNAIRSGHQDTVEGYLQQQDANLNMLPQNIQDIARAGGVAPNVADPNYARVKPYADAGDYENAFTQMTAQPDKGDFIEVDGGLFDTRNQRFIPNPSGPKLTDDQREYQEAVRQGFTGTFMDYMTTMKKAGAASTIIQPGERGYDTERGKGFGKRAEDIDAAEASAYDTIAALDSMSMAMRDPNFYSGFGAEQVAMLKKAMVAMGGDPDQVSSMEGFSAQAKQLALAAMGGSLGTGFSNADRDFVTGQVLSLDNTPAGNAKLMEIQRRIQRRKIEIAQLANQYEQEHGRLDVGFNIELRKFREENPLFPEARQQPSAPQAVPQQQPQVPGQPSMPQQNPQPSVDDILKLYPPRQ